MKKLLKIFYAGVLTSALCTGLVACNEPKDPGQEDEGTEIQPVPVNEVSAEVVTFFDTNNGIFASYFFYEGKLSAGKDSCVMINSADELPKVDNDGNPLEAPSIDFDSYTLIIGRASFGDTAWIIAEQNAVKGSKKITMYIHVERPRGMSYGLAIPSTISFWGLYPKLPNLPITVKRK